MEKTLFLSLQNSGPMTPVGAAVEAKDQPPTRRYIKPIIPLGTFTHPRKGWCLSVDDAQLDHWVDTFHQMKLNGDHPKLNKDHKHDADSVIGDVVDMMRGDVSGDSFTPAAKGKWLGAVVSVTGKENMNLVESNKDVSPEIYSSYVNGTKNEYKNCIRFISVVPTPVVPGQAGFKIAAGIDDDIQGQTLFLGVRTMAAKTYHAIEELAHHVGVTCPAAQAMDDDAGHTAVHNVREHLIAKERRYMGIQEEKDDLAKKLTAATAGKPVADVKYLSLGVKGLDRDFDALKGILSDKGVDLLRAELVGDVAKKEFSPLLMSIGDEEKGINTVERVLKIIRENPGVARGSKSPAQDAKYLSVDDPAAGDGKEKMTPERRIELLNMTSTGREILASENRKH